MGAGVVRWSGTFTMPASGPGSIASVDVAITGLLTTDRVVCTPSYTSKQTGWYDINGPFRVQTVKASGTFTAYADRPQFPADTLYDYVVLTNST